MGTTQTGCAVPGFALHGNAAALSDSVAEQVVVHDLLWYGRTAWDAVQRAGLDAGDFYFQRHADAYTVCGYLLQPVGGACGPADVFGEILRRNTRHEFAPDGGAAVWLADVWSLDWWQWALANKGMWPADEPLPCYAAACKVRWLASRRMMYYRGTELIRDAMNPVGGADENNYRAEGA
jgi:hypothetical protein